MDIYASMHIASVHILFLIAGLCLVLRLRFYDSLSNIFFLQWIDCYSSPLIFSSQMGVIKEVVKKASDNNNIELARCKIFRKVKK